MLFRWMAALRFRLWFGAACAAMLLAACGGGGGDGGDTGQLYPGRPELQGTWQLTVTVDGVTTAPVDVPADSVPSSTEVSRLSTAGMAQLTGTTLFQGGYTVSVSGDTITVTDPDTSFVLVINSLTSSGYEDCGACGVDTEVVFNVNMNYTAQGTLDGETVPPTTESLVLVLRFRRVA